jgi:hypothetical protein
MRKTLMVFILSVFLSACCFAMGGPLPKQTSEIKITSDPVGARIEIDQGVMGNTPLTVVISREYNPKYIGNTPDSVDYYEHMIIIQAFPTPELIKTYGTLYMQGKMFMQSDKIPKHIHFDLTLRPTPQEIKQDIKLDINK